MLRRNFEVLIGRVQFEPGSDHHNGRPASRCSAQPPLPPPSLLPEGRGRHQPLEHRTVPIEQLIPRRAQGEGVDVDPFEHSPLSTGNDDSEGVRSPPPPPPQQRMDGPRLVSPAIRLGEVVPPLRFHPEGKSRAAMPAAVGVAPPSPPPMTGVASKGAAVPVKEVLLPYSVSPPRPSVPMPLVHERDVERGEDGGPFGDDSQIFPGSDLF